MRTSIRRGAIAAGVLLAVTQARADLAPGTSDPNAQLSEVFVTATRVAQPLERALEPVLLIDRAALEDSLAVDVGDVLRFHAGLDIGRTGGPGQPESLFIRGANSSQSIIMIDGVRINPGTQSLAPLTNMAPELFDRIEIVKGPRSAIYGSDAIGGVVNLITRSGGASGASVMLDYGRYGTGEFAVDGNYTAGESSLQAAVSGQRSGGYPVFAGDWRDSGYKNLSGTLAATTRLAGVELGARYWQATGTTEYSNPSYPPPDYTLAGYLPASEHFSNSALAAHASGDISELWHARATLSRVIVDLRQNQDDPSNPDGGGDFDYTTRDTLDLQNDVRIKGTRISQTISFGAIVASERTNSASYGTTYSIGTHTQNYYLQDQLESGANRLLVAGGYTHHPAFGDHLTWNAEYGYTLAPGTLLTLAAGTAFRAPSSTDRFGYGGTPDLKPESSRNLELGLKSRIGAYQAVTIAAFQNTINDLIVFVNDPTNLVYYGENRNVDRARIRGVEASWEACIGPWSARAEGSLQDPRDLVSGAPLLRRTKHSFTLTGARDFGRAQIGIDLLQSGPRPDIDQLTFGPTQDGGYLLAAIRGKLNLTAAWSVAARLDNALDRHYQLANGYNTAGRAASVSTRYSFR